MHRQKPEEQCLYQNVKCMIAKKMKFIKQQEASGLLSSYGIKTPLNKIPLLDPFNPFCFNSIKRYSIK